nr:5747_t:CDS:2 [Entrophospora candida]
MSNGYHFMVDHGMNLSVMIKDLYSEHIVISTNPKEEEDYDGMIKTKLPCVLTIVASLKFEKSLNPRNYRYSQISGYMYVIMSC